MGRKKKNTAEPQQKPPTKAQRHAAWRGQNFDLTMKETPGFKFHRPGSQNRNK